MASLLRRFSAGSKPKQVSDFKPEEAALVNKINDETLRDYFYENRQDFPRSTTEIAIESLNKAMDLWPNAEELKYHLKSIDFPSSDELIKTMRNNRFISVVTNKTLKKALLDQSNFVCKEGVKKEMIKALNQFISENPSSEELARHLTQAGIPHTPELITSIKTEAATDLILKMIDSQILKNWMHSLSLSLDDVTPGNLQALNHNIKYALGDEDLKTLLTNIGIQPDDAFIREIREEHLRKQYRKDVKKLIDEKKIDKKEGWKIRIALEDETKPIQEIQAIMKRAGIEVESSEPVSTPPPSKSLETKEPSVQESLDKSSEVQKDDQEEILKHYFRTIVLNELQKKVKEKQKAAVKETMERIMFSFQWENLSILTMRALLKEAGLRIEGLQFFDAFENETRETRIHEIDLLLAQLDVLEQIEEKIGLAKSWLESSGQYAETLKADNPSFAKTDEWNQLQRELNLLRNNLRVLNVTLANLDASHLLVARAHKNSAAIQTLLIEAEKPAFTTSPSIPRKTKRSLSLEETIPAEQPLLEINTDALKKTNAEVSQQIENKRAVFFGAVIQANLLELTEWVGALKARMADIPRLSEEEKNALEKVATDPLAHLRAIQATADRFQSVKDEKEELDSLEQALKESIEKTPVDSELTSKVNDALNEVSSLEKETKQYLEDLTWLETQYQEAEADYFRSLELPPLEPIGGDLNELRAAQTKFVSTQAMLEEKGISLPQMGAYEKGLDASMEQAHAQKEQSKNIKIIANLEKLQEFQKLAQKHIEEAKKLVQTANEYATSKEIPSLAFIYEITGIQLTLKGKAFQLALHERKLLNSQTITASNREEIAGLVKQIQAFRDRFEEKAKKKAEKEAKKAEKEAQKALTRESNLQLKLEEALDYSNNEVLKLLAPQLEVLKKARFLNDVLNEFKQLKLLDTATKERQADKYEKCKTEYEALKKEGIQLSTEAQDMMSALTAQAEHPSKEPEKILNKARKRVEDSALKEIDTALMQGQIENLKKASKQSKEADVIEKERKTILKRIDDREKRYFEIREELQRQGFVFLNPEKSQKFNEIGMTLASFKAEVESLSPEQPKPRRKGSLPEPTTKPEEKKKRRFSFGGRKPSSEPKSRRDRRAESAPSIVDFFEQKVLTKEQEKFKKEAEALHEEVNDLNQQIIAAQDFFSARFPEEDVQPTADTLHQSRATLMQWLQWLDTAMETVLARHASLVESYNTASNEQKVTFYKALMLLEQPVAIATTQDEQFTRQLMQLVELDFGTLEQQHRSIYRAIVDLGDSDAEMNQLIDKLLTIDADLIAYENEVAEAIATYQPLRSNRETAQVLDQLVAHRSELRTYLHDAKVNISDQLELNISEQLEPVRKIAERLDEVVEQTPNRLAKLEDILKKSTLTEDAIARAKSLLSNIHLEEIEELQAQLKKALQAEETDIDALLSRLRLINPSAIDRVSKPIEKLSLSAEEDLKPIIAEFEREKKHLEEKAEQKIELSREIAAAKAEEERKAKIERPSQEPETAVAQESVIEAPKEIAVTKAKLIVEKPELEIVVIQSEKAPDKIVQPAAVQQSKSMQSMKPTRQKSTEFDLHEIVVTSSEKISGITKTYGKVITNTLSSWGEKLKEMFSFSHSSTTPTMINGFPPTKEKRPVSAIEAEEQQMKKPTKDQCKIAQETTVSTKKKTVSTLSQEEHRKRIKAFDHKTYISNLAKTDIKKLRIEISGQETKEKPINWDTLEKTNADQFPPIERYSMDFKDGTHIDYDVPDNRYELGNLEAMKNLVAVLKANGQLKINISEIPTELQIQVKRTFESNGIAVIGVAKELLDKPKALSVDSFRKKFKA